MREARDTTVETVARALAHDEYPHRSWHGWSESARGAYLRSARAAIDAHLTALSSAGMAVVPVEPTETMHNAARDWSLYKYGKPIGKEASDQCYRIMIAAALPPLASGGG